ncbi:MAG: hypothetical protein ACLGI9_11290, partial [Thermoanaerobaculia bacterium]
MKSNIGHIGWGAMAIAGILLALFLSGCGDDASAAAPVKAEVAPAKSAQSAIERGKYLVTVAGCNDCHTPIKMGPKGPEPDFS